jgi:hypothetical protein
VILINLSASVGSNCNNNNNNNNNNENDNNLIHYITNNSDVIQIMWRGSQITVQLHLNCSYYIHMTSTCLTT